MQNIIVRGKTVDESTRCVHYHSFADIIAVQFKCCREYYPCFYCHEETAGHQVERWKKSEWDVQAILCGNCKKELTINEYFSSNHQCPFCQAKFNPGCRKHYHLYFEMER